jgi:prephenate dehydrogenase
MANKPTVAIIGYGEFTKLMIKHLSPHMHVMVSSRQAKVNHDDLTFQEVDLKTSLGQEIIIPSIPSQFFTDFFTTNPHLINPKALIIDVCSVKVKPTEVMLHDAPKTCQILATHPLFGPASAQDGLKGQKIMLYPARLPAERYKNIKKFLKDILGLHIIEMAPEDHGKIMAYAQGLSHYLGRVMQNMRIPESELTTSAYNDLLGMKHIQGNDSWDLFESIMFENPYALEVHQRFKRAMVKLDTRLGIK